MHLVVREAKRGLDGLGERGTKERPAVVPAALMPGQGLHAHFRQGVGEAEAMQDARSVGTDLDAGPYLAQRPCSFIDVHIQARAKER